ncbi:MAG TPA: cupin domain-containing protein [Polyangiaceae bacterium]|nr:cupin domain-containing protein [Polyangiaceae bacterium]
MSTTHRYGALCALILAIAAGCTDDESPSTPGAAGAAGDSAAGAADSGEGGMGATEAGSAGAGTSEVGGAGTGGVGAAGPVAGAAGEGGSAGQLDTGEAGAGGLGEPLASSTLLDLDDVKTHPDAYTWFDFKPNVKKLILAGAADTQHIAILWYTVSDGGVALHYHAKTESVYVIHGTQTDAKGVYTDGTVYFNPPGSGHQITDSSGFFLLAYAAPPDFANTGLIEAYEPVRIDTTAANLTTTLSFTAGASGVKTYAIPLVATGGLAAVLLETTSPDPYAYQGNYVIVLKGSCDIDGVTLSQGKLVVAKELAPEAYRVSASSGSTCLAMGVSF